MTVTHKKTLWWLAVGWSVIIFIGCAWPGNGLPSQGNIDKFEHAGIFMLFALLWLNAGQSIRWVLLVGAAYGMALEIYQGIMPIGRSFDWFDEAADIAGTVLGVLIHVGFKQLIRMNKVQ